MLLGSWYKVAIWKHRPVFVKSVRDDAEVARLVWLYDPVCECWVIANRIAMNFSSGWSAQVLMQSPQCEDGKEYDGLFVMQGWTLLWQDVTVEVTLRSELMADELDRMQKLQDKAESCSCLHLVVWLVVEARQLDSQV